MAKPKVIHVCSNCGATAVKWIGRCPACEEWNTYDEKIVEKKVASPHSYAAFKKAPVKPLRITEIQTQHSSRILIPNDPELNRVLGGGIVRDSITLLGGQPGIGKSTLLLQLACGLGENVLYVSGEESPYQIKNRAERIQNQSDSCLVLAETNLLTIFQIADDVLPAVIIIDSIQTLFHPDIGQVPATLTQIRGCTYELHQFAKHRGVAIFIVGHITKDGNLAGPKTLEHIVDTVLHFEGDKHYMYRMVRTLKNRFGPTDEIGIYEMGNKGLIPVNNPSEFLLSPIDENLSGSSIASTIEGMRPWFIEVQALVSNAIYGNPQRSTMGFDNRRLNMLLAVMEKKSGFFFGQKDVFLNMAGGMRVFDPAADLGIVAALLSSYHDIPLNKKTCFTGELGLSGEIRGVKRLELRIQDAERLGFSKMYVSKYQKKQQLSVKKAIEIVQVGKLQELVSLLVG